MRMLRASVAWRVNVNTLEVRMTSRIALVVSLVVSGLSAAGAQPIPDRQQETLDEGECPELMRGVSLAVKEQSSGVTLTFATKYKQNLTELRNAVREAAAYLEFQSKMVQLHKDDLETVVDAPLPALDISVKNLPTGVVVTIRTENSHDARVLALQAQNLKDAWDNSACVAPGVNISRIQRVRH